MTGVIALEVVLPVIIATPIATALTRLAIGGGPIYGERSVTMHSELELFGHAVLGVMAGFVGPAFMAMLDRGEAPFERMKAPKPLAAALGGLGVGALAIFLPEVTGNGYEAINLVLGGQVTVGLTLVLILAKPSRRPRRYPPEVRVVCLPVALHRRGSRRNSGARVDARRFTRCRRRRRRICARRDGSAHGGNHSRARARRRHVRALR